MLNRFRNLIQKYAVISAVAIAFLFYAIMDVTGRLFSLIPESLVRDYAYQIVSLIYPVLLAVIFGFGYAYKGGSFAKGLKCGIFTIVLDSIVLAASLVSFLSDDSVVWNPWYLIIYGLLRVIGIAVREESIFRATIQNLLANKYAHSVKGVWITAIISAVIFGLIHAMNVFVGVEPLPAIIQSIVNVGAGLLSAAIYLRCENIWALIALHTFTDGSSLFTALFFDGSGNSAADVINTISWPTLFFGAAMAAVGAFLLRPSKCREIIERNAAKAQ